jgi:predicted small secreted protein
MIDLNIARRAVEAHSVGRVRVAVSPMAFVRMALSRAAVLVVLVSITAAGCATGDGAGEGASSSGIGGTVSANGAPPMVVQPGKVGSTVGVWEGLTLADCPLSAPNRCNAENKVSITLLQGDSGLRGFYTCGYATMDCLGQNETGKVVTATLNGGQLTTRVQMPDGTSCIYTGRTVGTGGNKINGGYSCYAGGAMIESGSWRGTRSY